MRMRSVLLTAVAGIAVVGAFAGLGQPVQGAGYTVSVHPLNDKNADNPVVLANSEGMSLYYYTADTATKSKCTGECAKTWLPLISNAPTKDPGIPGAVAVVKDVHGAHVTFNGHLLYTYAGDKPGEAAGQGRGGKWFVATPALARWW